MRVIYKCDCMAVEASVDVRARQDHEDVVAWAQAAQKAMLDDHQKRSPHCVRASGTHLMGRQTRRDL
jgi:hypothetical protein